MRCADVGRRWFADEIGSNCRKGQVHSTDREPEREREEDRQTDRQTKRHTHRNSHATLARIIIIFADQHARTLRHRQAAPPAARTCLPVPTTPPPPGEGGRGVGSRDLGSIRRATKKLE